MLLVRVTAQGYDLCGIHAGFHAHRNREIPSAELTPAESRYTEPT